MNEPRLMLLATATARFEQIDHPAKAMFEMFRIHDLRPLNDDECNTIWALVTGAPLPGLQIRPIRILTGGNARLIALIARFGEKRSFRDLLENLIDLIDEHTDYFKSHLDNMAPMERKVYLALAELWKQSSAKEIAEVARLDVNTTSAFLKRLASKGKVVVENEGKRKKWYSISEGIYNIYYLMRRRGGPSARVKAAVRFMVGLYEPVAAAKMVIDESCSLQPDECRVHMMALAEIYRSAPDMQRLEIARTVPFSVMESPYFESKVRNQMLVYRFANKEGQKEFIASLEANLRDLQNQFDRIKYINHETPDVADDDYKKVFNKYRNFLSMYGVLIAAMIVHISDFTERQIDEYVDVLIQIIAIGNAEEVLEIIVGSPAEKQLEPLVAGLRLYCGQEVRTAPEILEVAKDVVTRIEARKRVIDAAKK